jgi:cytochrome c551/c552
MMRAMTRRLAALLTVLFLMLPASAALAQTGGGGGGGGGGASAEATFTSKGCGACHTFSPIPAAQGKIGPNLDDLKEAAETAGMPLEEFIHESIVDPNAYLPPGFNPPSAMPSFKDTIPPADLDALVQ